MAQDTVTNLAEVIAEVNALDEKIENMETLDTLEEIEANTESGVIAGALAVKEINTSLTQTISRFGNSELLVQTDEETSEKSIFWHEVGETEWFPFKPTYKTQTLIVTKSVPRFSAPQHDIVFDELETVIGITKCLSHGDNGGTGVVSVVDNTARIQFGNTDWGDIVNITITVTAIGV